MNDDLLALEKFLLDNPELERLETLLCEFNIFEALGAVKVELRHSEFLAFLMNPNQNHGLGDFFTKRLLQKAVAGKKIGSLPFTAIDLDIWNLDDIEIRREWHQIDILVLSETHQLAIIIENKIGTKEHSNQLRRYYKSVEQQFHGWKILGIYLTPDGDIPSDNRYLSLSYEVICGLIESIIDSRKSILGPDIHTLMQHYTVMLRRFILSGSELEKLCYKIYRKHQRALDLLFEYRPDLQAELYDLMTQLIETTPGLTLDNPTKGYIRFVADEIDIPLLRKGGGWTLSNRILLFEIKNLADRMGIYLLIGPGPNETREKLFELSKKKDSILKPSQKTMGKNHQTIYHTALLTKIDYQSPDIGVLQKKIEKRWESFITDHLPQITVIIKEQQWFKDSIVSQETYDEKS